jgi:hypothetical protein
MIRCHAPVVQPVRSEEAKPKESLGYHFFRWLRWSAVCAMLIPVGIVGFVQWQHVRTAELEAELKQDMLERGMTAQDIERVLRSSQNPSRDRSTVAESNYYTARHAEIEAGLIKELAMLNMPADDVERIYKAFNAATSVSPKSHASSERAARDAAFVKRLAQSGRSAEDIERLIQVTRRKSEMAESQPSLEKSQRERIEDALKILLRSGLTKEEITEILASNAEAAEKK